MKLRVGLLVPLLLLVAGCGAAHPQHHHSPTPKPTAPAVISRTECSGKQLAGTFLGTQGLTGNQLTSTFVFRNVSNRSCTVSGIPAIHLVAANGEPISVDMISRQGTGAPPPTIKLPSDTPASTSAPRVGEATLSLNWFYALGSAATCTATQTEAAKAIFTLNGSSVVVLIPTQGKRLLLAPCHGYLGPFLFKPVS